MSSQLNELTEIQKAYIAGLFDGEGCICAVMWHGSLVMQIHVTNTDLPMLEMLKAWTGVGRLRQHAVGNGRKRNSFRWHLGWRDGLAVMQAIEPYLVSKAGQARLFIQAANAREFGKPKTLEQRREDEVFATAMVAAKRVEYDR